MNCHTNVIFKATLKCEAQPIASFVFYVYASLTEDE